MFKKFVVLGLGAIVIVYAGVIYKNYFDKKLLELIPINETGAVYKITHNCPENLRKGIAYCLEYVNEKKNNILVRVPIGISKYELNKYIDKSIINIEGNFNISSVQCIESKCKDIGGPYTVFDLNSFEPLDI